MTLIYSSFDLNKTDCPVSIFGGKAASLAKLSQAGFRVPPFIALSHKASLSFEGKLKQKPAKEFFQEIQQTISQLWKQKPTLRFAVRSSALSEDGKEQSYAGMYETVLGVSPAQVPGAVERVWASAKQERVKHYSAKSSQSGIGVVIQEMIDPDTSGVAFDGHPVSGNRSQVLISAVPGLGEGLVSGELNADNYVFESVGEKWKRVSREVAHKSHSLRFNKQFKPVKVKIPESSSTIPSLKDKDCREVATLVRACSAHFQAPQDIEWVLKKGTLYLVQSRPITTLAGRPDPSQQRRVWDNANIVESYNGLTLPLTFSFIKDIYRRVYVEFCRILGVNESILKTNQQYFAMLGLFEGRVYYNLRNWYNVLALLPGYEINARFMEGMMGVDQSLKEEPEVLLPKHGKTFRFIKSLLSLVLQFIALKRSVRQFFALTAAVFEPLENKDQIVITPEDCLRLYRELEAKLLENWRTPLVNDFFAMIFFGLAKKSLLKQGANESDINMLLQHQGGVISTEPIHRLKKMGQLIKEQSSFYVWFIRLKEPQLLNWYQGSLAWNDQTFKKNDKSFSDALREEVREHIRRFGSRTANELKLETLTAKEDPLIALKQVQAYANMDYEKIAIKESEPSLKMSNMTRWLVKQSQTLIRNRENMRFERTRLYAIVRKIFSQCGDWFYRENLLSQPRDIFYLSKEEVFAFIEGEVLPPDFKTLVQSRKKAYKKYEGLQLPDRFFSYGAAGLEGNAFDASPKTDSKKDHQNDKKLFGLGACPGVVEAEVQVVHDPAKAGDLKGKILIAEKTDPGWVLLFPLAKAILVERGSLLSHSAIVAREMGIPAVVQIPGLLKRFQSGMRVRMNGQTGEIEIL